MVRRVVADTSELSGDFALQRLRDIRDESGNAPYARTESDAQLALKGSAATVASNTAAIATTRAEEVSMNYFLGS